VVVAGHADRGAGGDLRPGAGRDPVAAYIWTHDIGSGLRADIGREFSLDGILDSFTQRKNVTVNLNTARRQ
jgi:betaine-aldehyde dehydrogenase